MSTFPPSNEPVELWDAETPREHTHAHVRSHTCTRQQNLSGVSAVEVSVGVHPSFTLHVVATTWWLAETTSASLSFRTTEFYDLSSGRSPGRTGCVFVEVPPYGRSRRGQGASITTDSQQLMHHPGVAVTPGVSTQLQHHLVNFCFVFVVCFSLQRSIKVPNILMFQSNTNHPLVSSFATSFGKETAYRQVCLLLM